MDDLDNKIRDFSSYLLDLGFLNSLNYNEFCQKFKEINKNNLASSEIEEIGTNISPTRFKDNASKTIVEFYNSMSEDKKKLFAKNIFTKYTEKKEIEKNKDYSQSGKIVNNNAIEYVIENIESFNILGVRKEEKNANKNNEKEKIEKKEEKNKDNLSFINFMNKKKEKKNTSFENKRNNKYALKNNKNAKEEESKQNKIILNENCTFHPNINCTNNRNNKSKANNTSVFDKLYNNYGNTKKKDMNDLAKERDKENIFQPNKEKNKKIRKNLSRKNFDERLKKLEDNKKDKEEKRKKDEEKEFKQKFPFQPKRHYSLNKSYRKDKNDSKDNLYQRLYEDNQKMKNKYEENLKQVMKEIKNRANHPIVRHNNINYISKMKREFEIKKNNIKNVSFDNHSKRSVPMSYNQIEEKKDKGKMYEFQRIEELYEEYKKIKNQINLKENQIKDDNNDINKENKNENEKNIENNLEIMNNTKYNENNKKDADNQDNNNIIIHDENKI